MEGELQRRRANIRRLRLDRRLSQEQLAEAIGVLERTCGGLERGERNVTLRAVERVASWLEVDPLVLLATPSQGSRADESTPPARPHWLCPRFNDLLDRVVATYVQGSAPLHIERTSNHPGVQRGGGR